MRSFRPPRRIAALVAALALASIAAACGSSSSSGSGAAGGSGSSSFTLTVGDLEAYTGDLGALGAPADKADKLAVQQLNSGAKQAGYGYHFQLKTADTQSDPQAALSAAHQVVDQGATCITGPLSTPEAIAILNGVTKVRHMAMLPSATSVALRQTNDDHTIFRTVPPDSLQARALVDAVKKALGSASGKTVAIGYQNSPYGQGLANTFATTWKADGGSVIGPVGYDPNQPSYDSEAGKLTSGNPDAFVFADYPDTFGKVAGALLRTGKFSASKLFVSDALAVTPIPKTIPAAAMNGAHATSAGSPTGTPQARAFNTLYTNAPGPPRSALDTNDFDAAVLCGLAAVAAGSTDPAKISAELPKLTGPGGQPFTYTQLPQAMKALREGKTIHYVGVSGPIEFNSSGDTSSGVYDLSKWMGGKLSTVGQINVKAGG